jgi:signal transduction histidine kinase
VRQHLFYAIGGTFGVAIIVFALVYLLSKRFNQFIAEPIAELTSVACRIANENNYKILAKKVYDDEIGDLATTFNRMIVKVRDYNEDLEALVDVRTGELSASLKNTEKALKKAEKADKHKSEWIRNMSHEFRTPVHGILSFAKFGIKDAENEEIPRDELFIYFKRIVQSTERLQYLVNGILDIAATESGKINLVLSECDLRDLTEDVVKELSGVVKDNDLKVEVGEASFSTVANVDGQRISQVIANLMGNAIKSSPNGSTLTIGFEKDKIAGKQALRVSIGDEGCGVPEAELVEIFDPFKQSTKTNDHSGGTGLGLSISKNIVEAHRGKILAENNAVKGAKFSFVVLVG